MSHKDAKDFHRFSMDPKCNFTTKNFTIVLSISRFWFYWFYLRAYRTSQRVHSLIWIMQFFVRAVNFMARLLSHELVRWQVIYFRVRTEEETPKDARAIRQQAKQGTPFNKRKKPLYHYYNKTIHSDFYYFCDLVPWFHFQNGCCGIVVSNAT